MYNILMGIVFIPKLTATTMDFNLRQFNGFFNIYGRIVEIKMQHLLCFTAILLILSLSAQRDFILVLNE